MPFISAHEIANSTTCSQQFSISHIERAPPEFFEYSKRIASDSAPVTLVSAGATLTTAELIRYVFTAQAGDPVFSDAFFLTLAPDALLTWLSHFISLGHFPSVERFFAGKTFGQRYEFLTRVTANAALGVGVIVANWWRVGVPVTVETTCGAAALCAAVYPVLITMKGLLFKRFPTYADKKSRASLERNHPAEIETLFEQAMNRADEVGVERKQAETMFLSFIEGVVTSHPYEDLISADSVLNNDLTIQFLKADLKAMQSKMLEAENDDAKLSAIKMQMPLRRKLVNRLLAIFDAAVIQENRALQTEIIELLRVSPEHSESTTIDIHRTLSKRAAKYWANIVGASLMDQAISVGVAGGVFLYAVNHWAATGETPWFLVW